MLAAPVVKLGVNVDDRGNGGDFSVHVDPIG
jgi:hypothetical protein